MKRFFPFLFSLMFSFFAFTNVAFAQTTAASNATPMELKADAGVQDYFQSQLFESLKTTSDYDFNTLKTLLSFLIVLNIFVTFYRSGEKAFLSEMIQMSFAAMLALCLIGGPFYESTQIGKGFNINDTVCGSKFEHQGGKSLADDVFYETKYMVESFGCTIFKENTNARYIDAMTNLSTIALKATYLDGKCVKKLDSGGTFQDVLACQKDGMAGPLAQTASVLANCGMTSAGCWAKAAIALSDDLVSKVIKFVVWVGSLLVQILNFMVFFGMQISLMASLLMLKMISPFLVLSTTRQSILKALKVPLTFAFYGFSQKMIYYFSSLLAEGTTTAALFTMRHFADSVGKFYYIWLLTALSAIAIFFIQFLFVARIPKFSSALMNLSLVELANITGSVLQAGFSMATSIGVSALSFGAGTAVGGMMAGGSALSGAAQSLGGRVAGGLSGLGGVGAAPPSPIRQTGVKAVLNRQAPGVSPSAPNGPTPDGGQGPGSGEGGEPGSRQSAATFKSESASDSKDSFIPYREEKNGQSAPKENPATSAETVNISANVVRLSGPIESEALTRSQVSSVSSALPALSGTVAQDLSPNSTASDMALAAGTSGGGGSGSGVVPAGEIASGGGDEGQSASESAAAEPSRMDENPRKRQLRTKRKSQDEILKEAQSFSDYQAKKQTAREEAEISDAIKGSLFTAGGRKALAKSVLSGGLNFAKTIVDSAAQGPGAEIQSTRAMSQLGAEVKKTAVQSGQTYRKDYEEYLSMVQERDDQDYEQRTLAAEDVGSLIDEKILENEKKVYPAMSFSDQKQFLTEMSGLIDKDEAKKMSKEQKAETEKKAEEFMQKMEQGEIYLEEENPYLQDMYNILKQTRPDLAKRAEEAIEKRKNNTQRFLDALAVILRNPKPELEELSELFDSLQEPLNPEGLESLSKHKEIIEAALNRARLNRAKPQK